MYKRIILKLSGEAIGKTGKSVEFQDDVIKEIIGQVKTLVSEGTQVGLVIGGGNIWRGRSADSNMDRVKADQIGMLATVINAVYVADMFRQSGLEAIVQTPYAIGNVTEMFSKEKALEHFTNGRILIFACGLGHPYFSTDTITALRAAELECDCVLYAKNIDGVYDDDPDKNPNAKKFDEIKCIDIVKKNLGVIDIAAASLCASEKIPLVIFGLTEKDGIIRAAKGDKIGTKVTV
ncbi:MAG: UMP kinase [Firmicutes bacterium]|nr:UMP kinase [Bacillota bacterium]MBQ7241680.1 UMP kinase [Bacillota bacterium]MBR0105552.1 UMP kinase [Bacillota bacterium]